MEQATLSCESVFEELIKTNRPPTDQERAIIQESMAPTNAKLKAVQGQISDTIAHIDALRLQVEQAETKLQQLREEEAAIQETFADHRRIFSPFRNLPEDVLREICITSVEMYTPTLSYRKNIQPWPYNNGPYVFAQISSGMRHIALTTPRLWTDMSVDVGPMYFHRLRSYEQAFSNLARRVITWFELAGGLALTIIIKDLSDHHYIRFEEIGSDPSIILFDTLLSYSTRWKEIQFHSGCAFISPVTVCIANLTAVDVRQLQSFSLVLDLDVPNSDSVLRDSVLLTIPTLRHVTLRTAAVRMFTVNWAVVTSITLHGNTEYDCYSKREIAGIFQKTKCLVFCNIVVHPTLPEEPHADKINLPFLKTLIVSEFSTEEPGDYSILEIITAPVLEICHIRGDSLDLSVEVEDFFKCSPRIWKLSLPYFDEDKSLTDTVVFLRHCPSLTELSLWSKNGYWQLGPRSADMFLRAFVEGDTGVLCPRLQNFNLRGKTNFSLKTLRLFLDGKQEDSGSLNSNVLPWKRVAIDISGIKAAETRSQILDLVSQKKATGLDVVVFLSN